ncbi:MAG: DUF1611 domain-containing protein [Proteobacteria bacterium]|nr:DUF1611 domain-containing protein [Pseudomonadota bacterium]
MRLIELPSRYLVFLGDVTDPSCAKTAFGLRDWTPERCVGEYALPGGTVSAGLPPLSPAQARRHGAEALVIAIANYGGVLSPDWIPTLLESLEAGLDLVSGMHMRLTDQCELRCAAERLGRRLIDIRNPPRDLPVGNGRKRTGKRLLTVGTDCALGKKYTALVLTREFKARALDADFRATGQTGILIAGTGMPMDAVVSDFVAGAAELLTPDAPENHWDVVEGQGSIFHPAYAGVSLGLLHGTQPDAIVVCHQLGRERLVDLPDFPTPTLEETIELTVRLARRTNPRARCVGISLNTSGIDQIAAQHALAEHAARLGLPVADPMRGGAELAELVAACLEP